MRNSQIKIHSVLFWSGRISSAQSLDSMSAPDLSRDSDRTEPDTIFHLSSFAPVLRSTMPHPNSRSSPKERRRICHISGIGTRRKKLGSAELASVCRIGSSVRFFPRPESVFRRIHLSHAQSLHQWTDTALDINFRNESFNCSRPQTR